MIIKYIFLLICFCLIFTVEDALYEELVRVIEAGWRVLKKGNEDSTGINEIQSDVFEL